LFEYFARRFAEVLTKGDVVELFRMLEQRYGSVSRVCERVGIERRTFYNWRVAKQVSGETKAKILRAALEEAPIDTLEFLARKLRDRLREVLELLIEFLRRELAEESPERVEEVVRRVERLLTEFSTPVTAYLHHEVARLVETARSRGLEIRVEPYTATQRTAWFRAFAESRSHTLFRAYAEPAASTTGTMMLEQLSPYGVPEV